MPLPEGIIANRFWNHGKNATVVVAVLDGNGATWSAYIYAGSPESELALADQARLFGNHLRKQDAVGLFKGHINFGQFGYGLFDDGTLRFLERLSDNGRLKPVWGEGNAKFEGLKYRS